MTNRQFQMFRCNMAGVDVVAASTRHAFPRHTHETFGIGVVDQGAQKSLSGRGLVEASAGDVITVNPGEVHDGMPLGDAGRSWRMLYFDPAVIAAAVNDLSQGKARLVEFPHPVITHAGLATQFRRLFALVTEERDVLAALQRDEAMLILLAEVIREQRHSDSETAVPAAIAKVRSRIDDDPLAPLTLTDLAQEAGLSRFQMLRGFARATGLTPHAYLMQCRIHLARRLIAGGTSLAEAAAASGFADQSHMTRIFVRKYGVTPGAYAAALT
ncbi:MAG TPA: AraC family transcriptional regulator [Dongiaceae bacterium]